MCNEPKVMVVDDNAELRSILLYGLESYGFQLTFWRETVSKPLKKTMQNEFDYIIADYRMPQMNGIELHEEFVSDHPGSSSSV